MVAYLQNCFQETDVQVRKTTKTTRIPYLSLTFTHGFSRVTKASTYQLTVLNNP